MGVSLIRYLSTITYEPVTIQQFGSVAHPFNTLLEYERSLNHPIRSYLFRTWIQLFYYVGDVDIGLGLLLTLIQFGAQYSSHDSVLIRTQPIYSTHNSLDSLGLELTHQLFTRHLNQLRTYLFYYYKWNSSTQLFSNSTPHSMNLIRSISTQ